jgi:protein TonB
VASAGGASLDEPAADTRAAYLKNPSPPYPESARRRGVEGLVVLEVRVSAAGAPDSVQVSRSSGHDLLDRAAADAVRRWRFTAARRAGVAVAATVEVPIRFSLRSN